MMLPWTGVQVRNCVLIRSMVRIMVLCDWYIIRFRSQIAVSMLFRRRCIPRSTQVLAHGMSTIQPVARRERCGLDVTASRFCCDHIVRAEIARLPDSRNLGFAVVYRRAQILVRAREMLMVLLFQSGRDVLFFRRLKFLQCGPRLYTAITSVIANVGYVVIDNRLIVDIVDDSCIADIRH